MNLLLKVLMVVLGTLLYVHGETSDGWAARLGKSNKIFKYRVGFPIGLLGCFVVHSYIPLLCLGSYFLASWALPYGETSPLTKWFGKSMACAIHGAGMGLASVFITHIWAILWAFIGGVSFYLIHVYDDAGRIKEPNIALYRSITSLFGLLGA